MMVVMLSSHGAAWTFFATAGDKLFMVETTSPPDENMSEALKHLVRESRWMFGDRRIVFMNRHDDWMEVLHDGAGNIKGFEPYDGPVPEQQEDYVDE